MWKVEYKHAKADSAWTTHGTYCSESSAMSVASQIVGEHFATRVVDSRGMGKWIFPVALGTVGLTGAITALLVYLILGREGLGFAEWSLLPSAILLIASLVGRNFPRFQCILAIAAVGFAVVVGGASTIVLTSPRHHGGPVTGPTAEILVFLAWMPTLVVAGVLLLVSVFLLFADSGSRAD